MIGVKQNFPCTMCFFSCATSDLLMQHVIRHHRYDPQFRVKCVHNGCAATFGKWKSFCQHLCRNHPDIPEFRDEINQEAELVEVEVNLPDIPCEVENNQNVGREDDENRAQPVVLPSEFLEWHAAKFLVNIRENCKVSQTAVDHLIDGVTNLLDAYLSVLLDELKRRCDPETKLLRLEDYQNILGNEYPPSSIYSSVCSKDALDKVLIEKFGMVMPQAHVIGATFQWKQKKRQFGTIPDLVEVNRHAYIIPFLDNLKNLLNNDEVRFHIENPSNNDKCILRTVLDGCYYRENDFFRNNENALAIILYYDDLGVTNPLGAASKTHKLSMFYWSLANINPEVRSSKDSIQLLAVVKTSFLKEFNALERILEPFISDIIKLQIEGVNITVNGQIKNFKGSVLFCAGDTPASAMIGGYKESVSAYRLCRSCMTTREEWKNNFHENNFILRNTNDHQEHIDAICEPNITKAAKNFWQKQYGINRKSPLMGIPNFDITMCLPQDCMHILIEGVAEIICRVTLRDCIIQNNLFTVDEFNEKLTCFHYGHFKRDKPAFIERDQLTENNTLRQKASQIFVLAHILPFLICEWILECEKEDIKDVINCHILLLQIMNVCLAYEVRTESIDLLSRMIQVFLLRFSRLHSDWITPKFHFMIHIPRYIKLFGPARQQWCFRFEAAHAYFKSLVPIVRNFKNIPFTLSYRHQARLSSRLASYPGMPSKKFLYKGDQVKTGPILLLKNLPYARLFNRFVDEAERDTCQIMRTSKIVIYGTMYEKNSIILYQFSNDNSLPLFAEINDLFVYQNWKLFIISHLETVNYCEELNAYLIERPVDTQQNVIATENLVFPHPLSSFTVMRGKYVPLINCDHVEFIG